MRADFKSIPNVAQIKANLMEYIRWAKTMGLDNKTIDGYVIYLRRFAETFDDPSDTPSIQDTLPGSRSGAAWYGPRGFLQWWNLRGSLNPPAEEDVMGAANRASQIARDGAREVLEEALAMLLGAPIQEIRDKHGYKTIHEFKTVLFSSVWRVKAYYDQMRCLYVDILGEEPADGMRALEIQSALRKRFYSVLDEKPALSTPVVPALVLDDKTLKNAILERWEGMRQGGAQTAVDEVLSAVIAYFRLHP